MLTTYQRIMIRIGEFALIISVAILIIQITKWEYNIY